MKLEVRANHEITRLTGELASLTGVLVDRFPVEDYLRDVKAHRQLARNAYFSRKRKRILEQLEAEQGGGARACHHRLALASLVADSLERLKDADLPTSDPRHYHDWYDRVLEDLHRQPDEYYRHQNPRFRMDLGVCCLRSHPVGGAWVVQVARAGALPFLGGGASAFMNYAWFLAVRVRGFSPFCVIHTVERYLPRFNEQNMHAAYLQIADLMRQDARIRGIYRRSWFLDPKLAAITPALAYLSRIPRENGASFFPCRPIAMDRKQGLSMSAARRKLHAQGKYTPRGYAYIWPRRPFLAWAGQQAANGSP